MRESIRKLLELMRDLDKPADSESITRVIALLHISNNQFENEIQNKIPFTRVTKIIENPGISQEHATRLWGKILNSNTRHSDSSLLKER